MPGSIHKNPQSFQRCSNIPLCRVRLVTTMWDNLMGHQTEAENRESELISDFWQPLISKGAATKRFYNTPASALEIIEELLRQNGEITQQNGSNVTTKENHSSRCFGLF